MKAPASVQVARVTRATSAKVAASRSLGPKMFGNTAGLSMSSKGSAPQRGALEVCAALSDLRDRIESVKNTQKITDAMKLVAAAKVRRAQEAVIGGRPFSENLVKVLFSVNDRLDGDEEVSLATIRPVKNVLLVVCTGDRGLCGGFNSFMIKKAEKRVAELAEMGVSASLILVGKKAQKYFQKRPQYNTIASFDMGNKPTTAEAQAVADQIYASFESEEVDKVELLYTKFKSLIATIPTVQTLLPLAPEGQVCDVNGVCVDAAEDEIFKLTSKDGAFAVERETLTTDTAPMESNIIFEQSPGEIMEALLPLYMNSQVLRAFQESTASELASRMNAMSSASDNAKDLKKSLSLSYNRQRQAKITAELIELCAGS